MKPSLKIIYSVTAAYFPTELIPLWEQKGAVDDAFTDRKTEKEGLRQVYNVFITSEVMLKNKADISCWDLPPEMGQEAVLPLLNGSP